MPPSPPRRGAGGIGGVRGVALSHHPLEGRQDIGRDMAVAILRADVKLLARSDGMDGIAARGATMRWDHRLERRGRRGRLGSRRTMALVREIGFVGGLLALLLPGAVHAWDDQDLTQREVARIFEV